jgi:curved DNA-binding protein CbpA
MTRSLYTILNVAPDADPAVIEAAHKALMKKYHPDVLTDEPESIQRKAAEINEAFNILKDPAKRAQYDAGERARNEAARRSAVTLAEAQRAYQPPPMARHRPRRKWPALITIAAVALLVFFIWRGADPANGGRAAELSTKATGADETGGELSAVRAEDVDRAISEFRRVRNRSGLLGLSGYSQDCFAAQARSAKASDFDFCVAFDRAASSYNEGKPGYYYLPQLPRFQPREQSQRHAAAGSLVSGDENLIRERVERINQLASARLGIARETPPPVQTELRQKRAVATLPKEPRYVQRRRAQRVAEAPRRRAPTQKRRPQRGDPDFLEREGYIY